MMIKDFAQMAAIQRQQAIDSIKMTTVSTKTFAYTTLENTKVVRYRNTTSHLFQYIKRNKPHSLTMQEALAMVKNESRY